MPVTERPCPEVQVARDFDSVRVKLNGLMHLHLPLSSYRGLQSWKGRSSYFAIEYTLGGGHTILCEYDQRETFEAILRGLDGVL